MHKVFLQIILFPLVFTMGVPCFGNGVGLPDVIENGAELVEVYSSGHFFEGPVWDPATAKLYFTINSSNQILRLDSPGSATVWMENTQGINGMCLSLEGKLLCAQVAAHQVPSYTIGADGPENEIILASDSSWNQPNDVRQSITGDIYFTDPNFVTTSLSAVYHLATNGTGNQDNYRNVSPERPCGLQRRQHTLRRQQL